MGRVVNLGATSGFHDQVDHIQRQQTIFSQAAALQKCVILALILWLRDSLQLP